MAPSGLRASGVRDLPLGAGAESRTNVHFFAPGFIGCVRDPLAVRRELPVELVKRRSQERARATARFERMYPEVSSCLKSRLAVQEITPVAAPVPQKSGSPAAGKMFRGTRAVSVDSAKLTTARESQLPAIWRPDRECVGCRIER